MIYPIVLYGSPVLRKETKEIDANYENLAEIIDNMWETMYNAEGVGLAAPQVGLDISLFIVDGSGMVEDFPELEDFKRVFINAEIIEESDETERDFEGCLSIPGIREEVSRPHRIRIKYLDENFVEHDEVYEGFGARIIQHEYDHIEGVLFTDHLSILTKRLIKSKLNSISQGKVNVDYRVRSLVK